MRIGSLSILDIAIVVAYLGAVLYIGKRAAAGNNSEDGFFLAGRKLGKLYQFFLNFGNATEPSGAVSTASFVYQQGASGSWLSFQTVFMNPYFWFMNVWFRRARLTTVSDLFEDRFASRRLSMFYAVFQILVACVFLGFANVTAYKIASSLVVKQPAEWTAQERASVDGYNEMKRLEHEASAHTITPAGHIRLEILQDRDARGQLHSYITLLPDFLFYGVFAAVVGAYIVMGGMSAAAVNEGLQSVLIIVFSVLLIPVGLHAIGGWHALGAKVPRRMFDLFGSGAAGQFSVWSLVGILLVSIVQNGGLSHNMGICGSATNEFSARSGVSGTYLKRLMIILWVFAGLIAFAIFGANGLSDPDATWGALSSRLLGPGLIGLMLAGVLAGTMSTLAAKALAISSLFVRNVYRQIWPDISQKQGVFYARWTIVVVLALGAVSAWLMGDFLSIVNIVLTVNVPFGACVLMTFFWRRLTTPAVWACVVLSTVTILVIPWTASKFSVLSHNQSLTVMAPTPSGEPAGVYFATVVHAKANDLASPLIGSGRFDFECWLLGKTGVNIARLTPSQRLTLQFFFDALFPFAVLLVVSWITPVTDPARAAQFYGKMKTPVGATPELEVLAVEETRRNPGRFDHTKLFPRSNWEFCKWDRVDTIGFAACCAASFSIVAVFVLLLHWAAH
ncbi:sodium/proline symporter [mine drainage metagenome]|uniref:Sodium/proline symporter n=1 Tax=mine drainage metagenome TaxID=410659 RepID=A0A1J5S3T7_9ZZZZ